MLKLLVSLLLPFLAAAVGFLATYSAIPVWYAGLIKPTWGPPNYLFGPVWTILYLMMGISYYLVITQKFNKKVLSATRIYYLQLIFNTLWSVVFFAYQSPFLAFLVIIVLWTLIIITIVDFYRVNKIAAYLMIPYILWVSFASILNLTIFLLNR